MTTNLVQVDVVVTDKEGRPVTDLRPEEFEISEEGKRQTITNFSYVAANPSQPATTAASSAPPSKSNAAPVQPARLRREQVRRTIALVVDDLGLSFESVGFVRNGLKKFVDEQMQPSDLVAILRTSAGVTATQQFTSDKRLLHAAIGRVRWYPQGRGGLSPQGNLNEATVGSDVRDSLQNIRDMEEQRAGLYSVGAFGTVGGIVRGLGDMPGRKSLVFISEAFRLFSAQGRNVQLVETMERLTAEANAASVSIYTMDASGLQTDTFQASDKEAANAYVISPETFRSTAGTRGSVQGNPPRRSLNRADNLSASAQAEADSGAGLRRLGGMMDQRREERTESHSVLSFLASKTGGLFMRNRNDLGAAMKTIMDDQSGYYLIGYRPDDATVDPATGRPRMRNLSVKVKRQGASARTRASYVGVTDGTGRAKPRTREEQLAAALVSPFGSGDVRLRLTSLFGTEAGSGATFARSLLHIDTRDLTFKEEAGGAHVADVEVVAVAFGDTGQVVDQLSYPQTIRAQNKEAFERMQQSGVFYILNFPIKKAGAYQMRVAVRETSSERIGAASTYVEIPDLSKNRLALSGVVLSGIQTAPVKPATTTVAAAGSTPATATAAAGSAPEIDPQSGPAVRRLRQGMMLDYRYNIYNAQLDPQGRPQLQTQMRLFREGQPVFTGRQLPLDASQQRDMKRLNAAGRIRVGPELTPGEYSLQVTVTDALAPAANRVATQWIDFEIVN